NRVVPECIALLARHTRSLQVPAGVQREEREHIQFLIQPLLLEAEMLVGVESLLASGYSEERVADLPTGLVESNAACGNPIDIAGLKEGETVLDLGSGAGLDCFLAAGEVGGSGRSIGLDMTDAMLAKAEANHEKMGLVNVEFRKGEMEAMPVGDGEVDAIISNCVINLSPDKAAVFRESHRVLKHGGRFVVSDVIKGEGFEGQGSTEEWCACIAGAISEEEYLGGLRAAGFEEAEIVSRTPYLVEGLESAVVRAVKPRKKP
ncbi:MAG: methyltransferase domain-containing protein, partial [Nitrospinota bacterium]|nr:methyltransferase domain-containing protein [Nitrospinota bacterium]